MFGNPPKFIETTRRTPTPALDPVLERNIERCAINAGLPTRNYFHLPSQRI
jgi:hypothetical protein